MYIITLSFTFHESKYHLENNNKLREGLSFGKIDYTCNDIIIFFFIDRLEVHINTIVKQDVRDAYAQFSRARMRSSISARMNKSNFTTKKRV